MSRIGKLPISIPAGISYTFKDGLFTAKGPKGELSQTIEAGFEIKEEDGALSISRPSETKEHRSKHGLYRSLINNMIEGVHTGFKKELELVGVGFRATSQGQNLEMVLGYSHPIVMVLPPEIKVEAKTERNKNPLITLESHDKQLLGQVCAKIRSLRKIEPYKGKGVRFVGEQIRRKAGKSAKV